MDDLIARLENATGPDRSIDDAIFELAHGRKRGRSTFEQYEPSERLPEYTGSIDAALTLVPEGYTWIAGDGGIMAGEPNDLRYGAIVFTEPGPEQEAASGSNPAIALCIAALKARTAALYIHSRRDGERS